MIRILPLQNAALDARHQPLCEAIAAKTIPALERLNPDHLGIFSSPSATQNEQGLGEPHSADQKADYVLTWTLQEEGDGLTGN